LICEITGAHLAGQFASGRQDESCLPEVRSPGCTIVRWRDQIVAWHQALMSNGPAAAISNLIKRLGFRPFSHYRIRVLLHAGKPSGDLLAPVAPR
jgi:transposase